MPSDEKENLKIILNSDRDVSQSRIGLTLAHTADAGSICFLLNGEKIRFGTNDTLKLYMPSRRILDNHFSETVTLKQGKNELVLKMPDADGRKAARIDFLWLR